MNPRGDRRTIWAAAAFLGLTFAVFGRTVGHGWLDYDDRYHVTDNPWFANITGESFTHFWEHAYGNLYIPVSYNLMALLAEASRITGRVGTVAESNPKFFHVALLGCHASSSILVFVLLRRFGAAAGGAFAGAALFCIHPLQVEAVSWVSELRGVIATTLALGSMVLYFRISNRVNERAVRWWPTYSLATVCFALSLLCKPSVVVVPLLVVILDRLAHRDWKRTLKWMLPWVAGAVCIVQVTRHLQPGGGVAPGAPLWARPFIAGDAAAFYLAKLFVPVGLAPDYARTPAALMTHGGWWAIALIPATVVLTLFWIARRRPGFGWAKGAFVGSVLMLATLSPVLGLASFDHQKISTVADRYMYLAMLGPALAVGLAWPLRPPRRLTTAALAVALGLAALSFRQAGHWRSDITLWSQSERVSPRSVTTLNNLGFALAKAGRREEAILRYRRALATNAATPVLLTNLAWELMESPAATAEAERHYQHALQLDPDYGRGHLGLGVLLARQGHVQRATNHLARAVELRPDDAQAAHNLGLALAQLGRYGDAVPHYRRSLAIDGSSAPTWVQLADSLTALGEFEQAATAFENAVSADPGQWRAWFSLADEHARSGDLAAAAAAYRRTLELQPAHADAANNLGLVLIRSGDIDGAIAAFSTAVASDPALQAARVNLENALVLKARAVPK